MAVPMQFGLMLRFGEHFTPPGRTIGWREVRELARTAEAVGFDTLWVDDHFLYDKPPLVAEGAGPRGFWDAWMLLAALADATERVTLGPLVTCTSYRQPALLAKMADTLEEISGGRLILGLGAGWHEPEYRQLGYPFDHLASRFEESLKIVVPLLREGHVDFAGQYYEARDCELRPRGPRPSGPPIWIGARGPRMMRLVARYADGYNTTWHATPDTLAERWQALDEACRDVGRDPATITRTAGSYMGLAGPNGEEPPPQMRPGIRGSIDEVAERLAQYPAAGVEHMTLSLEPWDMAGVERAGRVIEKVRHLTATASS